MSRTSLAWSLTTALVAAAGCSSGRPDSGPDGGESAADAAPFTAGVSTLAGAAQPGYYDGDRASGRFDDPVNTAWGPDGQLYIADFNNSKIRVLDTMGNSDTIVAQKNFIRPFGLLWLADGTLLVSTDNDPTGANNLQSGTLWKIDLATHTANVYLADIGRPRGLALLPSGLVAMSDEFHHVIRTIDPSIAAPTAADIVNVAGTWDAAGMADGQGSAARFSTPYGIATMPDGSLAVADYDNARVRMVQLDGTVTTMTGGTAGFADGTMSAAQFSKPQAIVANAAGDLFVTDTDNYRIRKVSGATVTTIAGDGKGGYLDSDDATTAELFGLEGLTLNKDGSVLYFADGNRGEVVPYNRVRQVKL